MPVEAPSAAPVERQPGPTEAVTHTNGSVPKSKPAMSYEERAKRVRASYARGDFQDAFNVAREAKAARFEENDEGFWIFRRDELNRLSALAADRLAIDRVRSSQVDVTPLFCFAVTVAPDATRELSKRFRVPAKAREPFERALRTCSMEGGFRSSIACTPATRRGLRFSRRMPMAGGQRMDSSLALRSFQLRLRNSFGRAI